MSKPKEYSSMTKDKLMTYTFIALLAITIVTAVLWWQVTPTETVSLSPYVTRPSIMNLGLTVIVGALIAVGVAVGIDVLFHKLVSDSPLNIMSAAVFGLIVVDSYSLGIPSMSAEIGGLPVDAPGAFVWIALISLVGMVVFKKVSSLLGRKMVNPAAAAKFLLLLPSIGTTLLAKEHFATLTEGGLSVPKLAGPIGHTVIGSNGYFVSGSDTSFFGYLQSCFSAPNVPLDVNQTMLLEKFHGWAGGACSLAVIIAGIALFIVARRYIKWRITLTYFVTIAIMSVLMSVLYADAGFDTRLLFEIFIGSSIFLGFFMATDPASTPMTYTGQIIFGVGLAVLTVLIQTYMNFFGGSILALIIMNLFAGKLDNIGRLKPTTESKEPKLPKAKAVPAEKVKEYQCMRCGACMRVCCHKLSPIIIKTAYDKMNFDALSKLNADYCTGCGHCTFVCPARIDLRKSVLMAKAALRGQ
jgi:Na+-translocating ferredoxin:NAD+ oxidoreductase RnfD subunit/NAD-dependent dihydropyrimidine dehydrogenase PreA subunit